MADDSILAGTIALRAAALEELQRTPAFVRFKALDDALRAMGHKIDAGAALVHLDRVKVGSSKSAEQADIWASTLTSFLTNQHHGSYRSQHSARRLSQAEGALALIREAGKPLTVAEIVSGLPRVGSAAGGENPEINVSSSLSRDERLESLRLGGRSVWWEKNVPLPPADVDVRQVEADLGTQSSQPARGLGS